MNHRIHKPGFSLIEITIVVVILGVIAVIAMPRFAGAHANYRVQMTARRIAADLELARAHARANSQSRAVSFNVSTQSYSLSGISDPDHPANAYTVELGDAHDLATLQSANFGGSSTVTFNGFGRPTAGGKVVVENAGRYYVVLVDGNTGRITLNPE